MTASIRVIKVRAGDVLATRAGYQWLALEDGELPSFGLTVVSICGERFPTRDGMGDDVHFELHARRDAWRHPRRVVGNVLDLAETAAE